MPPDVVSRLSLPFSSLPDQLRVREGTAIDTLQLVGVALLGALAALAGEQLLRYVQGRRWLADAEESAARLRTSASNEAERVRATADADAAEILREAEERVEELRRTHRKDSRARQRAIDEAERNLERRLKLLEQREHDIEEHAREARAVFERAEEKERLAQQSVVEVRRRMESVARCTAEQARDELRDEMLAEAREAAQQELEQIERDARSEAQMRSRWQTALAIQRGALWQTVETTVSVVKLPSNDMKGRIIGREGRNIRSIEMATGVDLIVDDTPSAIVLSCFDPSRREIARIAIERLVADGRIHPARIEDTVRRVREEFEQSVLTSGEAAAFELGIADLSERLIRLIGRMNYRFVEGYSLLAHAREVARVASLLAAELSADADVLRRAALLHHLGHVDDSGSSKHPMLLSAEIAARNEQSPAVVHAIEALHADVAARSIEAVLLEAADQISLHRPGAARDMLQKHVQRLQAMEELALEFKGVSEALAVRAGKELRVIVRAEDTTDEDVMWLSKDIARKLEGNLTYPGQIRVSVIREVRAEGFAV